MTDAAAPAGASSSGAANAVTAAAAVDPPTSNDGGGDDPLTATPEESPATASQAAPVPKADDGKNKKDGDSEILDTATDATAESTDKTPDEKTAASSSSGSDTHIIVSSNRKNRPPYKFDPHKITLRFLFANRDGLTVTVECKPSDTVGEVKGALISVWPDDMPDCDSGESLRLICMGKGFLTPDTRTLEDCQIPVFKTHPTPVNVSVKPSTKHHEGIVDHFKKKGSAATASGTRTASTALANTNETSQGCGCVIL